MIIPVIIAILAVAVAVPAYGCETLIECKHGNTAQPEEVGVFAPTDAVKVQNERTTHVKIYGAIPIQEKRDIIVTVTAPDGASQTQTGTTTDKGLFNIFYIVEGSRELEGRYGVQAWHRDRNSGSAAPQTAIGSTEFHVAVSGIKRGDITIDILQGAYEKGCERTPDCYDRTAYTVRAGQLVEWRNLDSEKHRMQSNAIGYGSDPPQVIDEKIIKTDNYFVSAVVEPGTSEYHTFTRAGTVLFACQFHPWMEAIISITGNDIVPDKDPPKTVQEIVEVEIPKVIVDLERSSLRTGEELVLEYTHPDTGFRTAIRIEDSNGNILVQRQPTAGLTGKFTALVQPSWPTGLYDLYLVYSDEVRKVNFKVTTDSPCENIESAEHGIDGGCWAARIDSVISGDRLVIGGETIVTSLALANADTAARTEAECPVGTVAIIDRDSTLFADTRFDADILLYKSTEEIYAAIYCTGSSVSLNEYMLNNGLAVPDPVGCITTEFDWASCPAILDPEPEPEPVLDPEPVQAPENDCLIAFAVLNTPLATQVQEMREYRSVMYDNGWQPVIDSAHALYYAVSPPIAGLERASPEFRGMVYSWLVIPLHVASFAGGIVAA